MDAVREDEQIYDEDWALDELTRVAFARCEFTEVDLTEAVLAGCTAVIQPGGSIGDDKVIAAADERGIAMVFTGVRVFRH